MRFVGLGLGLVVGVGVGVGWEGGRRSGLWRVVVLLCELFCLLLWGLIVVVLVVLVEGSGCGGWRS